MGVHCNLMRLRVWCACRTWTLPHGVYCTATHTYNLKTVREKLSREREAPLISRPMCACFSLYRQQQAQDVLGPGWLLPHKKRCSALKGLEREIEVYRERESV
jgi:hypothetical protein